ncbi:MAG: AAA family ATPase [Acidobacteriota bacterium]
MASKGKRDRFGFAARAIRKLLGGDDQHVLVRRRVEGGRDIFLECVVDTDPTMRDTLASLSDGYQSMIALVMDILEIMLKHHDDVSDAEGLVLIDEIDVHHPQWKIEIVKLVREVFPRVQFVITTHDPLCLLGAMPGELHILRRNFETLLIDAIQQDVPPGTSARRVLTGFWFGLKSTLDGETLEMYERHRKLLRRQQSQVRPVSPHRKRSRT